MKRFLALLLAICLLTSFAPVMAEDAANTELSADGAEATMEVNLTIDRSLDTFKVVIPSKLTINPIEKMGTISISVVQEGFNLISCEYLNIYLKASENYDESKKSLYLVNRDDETKKVAYDFTYYGARKYPGDCIFSLSREATNAIDFTKEYKSTVDTLPRTVGTYCDTLTFGVTCANAAGK